MTQMADKNRVAFLVTTARQTNLHEELVETKASRLFSRPHQRARCHLTAHRQPRDPDDGQPLLTPSYVSQYSRQSQDGCNEVRAGPECPDQTTTVEKE